MFMSPQDYNKIKEEVSRTRISTLRTIKDRKRIEMEYLDAIKKQMGYWKSQMDITDPEKDKDRYDELKKNIESEKVHIKQVQSELNKINEEIKREMNIQR